MPEGEGGAPAAPEGGSEFKAITSQEELDRRVGDRLARERAKFADYDDLKAKAAKFDEVDQASKTELQKLQDGINERDAKIAGLPGEIRQQAIRFASEATRAGFLDPEDALLNLSDVDLSDNDAVKAALADLAERKPHLVREAPKPKLPAKPKPAKGKEGGADASEELDGTEGKERAAAALRQFRGTT